MPIIAGGKEFRELLVGEMSGRAAHALLHRPGIRSVAQHFEIVVGFDDQHGTTAEGVFHVRQQASEIGGDCDLDALREEGEAHWIYRIMRNREWGDSNVSDAK